MVSSTDSVVGVPFNSLVSRMNFNAVLFSWKGCVTSCLLIEAYVATTVELLSTTCEDCATAEVLPRLGISKVSTTGESTKLNPSDEWEWEAPSSTAWIESLRKLREWLLNWKPNAYKQQKIVMRLECILTAYRPSKNSIRQLFKQFVTLLVS
jgi:hypothetical protein